MERQTVYDVQKKYMSELELAVRHPILKRDIGLVNIDKAKVFFLLLPKLNGEKWSEPINTAAIAVGAVQAGFDAHDKINASDATSTTQQLTVLSGDYYSGVHYRLLASIPHIDFIRSLAQVIGQINETKTNYQDRSPEGSEQLLKAVRIIETGCITRFLHKFGFSKYIPLVEAALPLISMEMDRAPLYKGRGIDSFGWTIKEIDAENIIEKLRKEIKTELEKADFINPSLRSEIFEMTIPLLEKPI